MLQVKSFGGISLRYALLGDLHSHKKKTKKVLKHIEQHAPDAEVIGLGDLYECIIGKKKAVTMRNVPLTNAAIYNEEFTKLLTFPSVIGNQEERIALVTGQQQFLQFEDEIQIEHATIVHGHQFNWDEQFSPTFPHFTTPLVFFGHSHRAAIYDNGKRKEVPYDMPIFVGDKPYIINVGAVVETKDWCLYDSTKMTVTFMRA